MTVRKGILTIVLLAGVVGLPAVADVVYLGDGHALHGKVTRQMELIIDPATGQPVPIIKSSPCFIIDDRVRLSLFSNRTVTETDKDTNIFDGHVFFTMPFARVARSRPNQATIGHATPFDDKWERKVNVTIIEDLSKFAQPGVPVNPANRYKTTETKLKQKITHLSPYYLRIECVEYEWQANYLTSEFGPDVVIPLLRVHPDMKEKPGEPDFEKQFKLFRFCTQAGWHVSAQQELAKIKQNFPNEAQKVAAAETGLRQFLQQKLYQEAEMAAKVGRHNHVQSLLKQVNVADLPGPLQADASSLKSRYEALQGKLQQTRQALATCYGDVMGPPIDFVGEAMPVICRELSIDNMDRLEPFTALGRQVENDRKNGRETQYSLDQVIAAAVTGWVLGPSAAEASISSAERLWSVREQILAIQRTASPIERGRLTSELERSAKLTIDEIARAITLLPPPDMEPIPATVMDRQTQNVFSGQPPVSYRLQMPNEYNPNRAYPLLIVLPNVGQAVEDAFKPWAAEAMRNGYILAVVDWSKGKNTYEYKPTEHASVLECLRDVKRFVNVDTDRIALTGLGEGANMAIDVGLSHADLFAAIVPVNGRSRAFISVWYWRHAQSLPFYVVLGEMTGSVRTWALDLFEKWAAKAYPSLLVMYKGRPLEFYAGEVPNIFDWLSRKRRSAGFPNLGRNPGATSSESEEYHSYRTTDNHFYWASTENIGEKHLLSDFLGQKIPTPAAIQANIRDANQITVTTRGLKQLTLWFGRLYDEQTGTRDMIDFTKPIKITVNGRNPWTNGGQPLTPKLATLMEDLFQRNDRRRLFLARVDFNNVQ